MEDRLTMQGKPAPGGWTRMARALHWGMALAIAVEVPAGFIMGWTYAAKPMGHAPQHILASQVHHTLGMLLLLAVVVRLGWRIGHRAPDLPVGTPPVSALGSRVVQVLLYALMFIVPLAGWAALSSLAAGAGYPAPPMWFFGHDGFGPGGLIPHIVPPVAWNAPTLFKYGFFGKMHVWGLIAGGVLLGLHVAGALWHQFVRRDGLIARMWRGQ